MKEKTKNSKGKGLVATLSNIENDSSYEYLDECGHFMVFAATTDKVIVESASDSEDSSDDEVPKKLILQEAYDKLCTKFIKFEKTSHLCRKELNKVKTKKAELLVKLDETTRLVETLVMENTSLEENVKNLEVELSQVRIQIERTSSAKLNEILSAQKPSSDKTGLGYVVSFNPSSSMTSRSKTLFVHQSKKGDKGMKSKTDLANSKSFVRLTQGSLVVQKLLMFVTIVVFLDTFVLICVKLYPQKQVFKRSQVSFQGTTPLFGELLKDLSFLTQFQENSNSSMSFSRHTRIRVFSSSRPKTRVAWVRKEPKT